MAHVAQSYYLYVANDVFVPTGTDLDVKLLTKFLLASRCKFHTYFSHGSNSMSTAMHGFPHVGVKEDGSKT